MRLALNLALVSIYPLLLILAPASAVGQVPKELPDWFKLLDEDQDGQVTLFEWRQAGKSIDEFKEWDRNDDGLITSAELIARLRSNPDLALVDDGLGDVRMGKMMFTREWSVHDPRTAKGDGLGPVFNATSCAHCHSKGGLGGSGDLKHNVTTFVREGENGKLVQGVIHAHATSPEFQENLSHAHPSLAPIVEPTLKQIMRLQISRATFQVNQLNPPALFGAKFIDDLPDQVILDTERHQKLRWKNMFGAPIGRALRLSDGSIGKFGWKAQSPTLLDFVQGACANELGLSNPDHPQPAPLARVPYRQRGLDLTLAQCEQLASFVASLPRPVEMPSSNPQNNLKITRGRGQFDKVGCADCHVPAMGSLSGVYSDLLLHSMGSDLEGSASYYSPKLIADPRNAQPDEWRTPPLWGVADSQPYLHDGRAPTLHDAIIMHAGQAKKSASNYVNLSLAERENLLYFLKSLRAPG